MEEEDIDIYEELRWEYGQELLRDLRIKRGEGWRYEELDYDEEEFIKQTEEWHDE
jgi:hypothetical protein